ncbi:murein L,D-transpeptidase catalytic domain family protein [Ancylobacter mangrovi]|uniref:murein L,D-transpeptidase catalytic domain family protein n=1 Tax=Ancylobacter mangrovi TaxID=2972472 RepID=UPI002161451C|nr:murein L,D-transpeptidase catalytic domain family protein [Ancylobacter mangrovi]MCS0504308.1 murein L,D-transpeptidase catalytic domain family protein [Ancylobacter mangrovi]
MTTIWLSRILFTALAVLAWHGPVAAAPSSSPPAWLKAHIGEDDGEIAPVVLQRARALYLRKVSEGKVRNPCYFAMDATRPAYTGKGDLGRRFYIICEAQKSFRAVSSGHGGGRNLKGLANFANGRQCAKNFGNAQDSLLTAGGAYVTAEIKTSFKGYYRTASGKDAVLMRSFVQFDGEGETANARERELGGHAAHLLRAYCRRKSPNSPYAGDDGYVPVGKLVDYAAGRSNGCTSWSVPAAADIVPMTKDRPTTLYIYPESEDIDAVAQAVTAHRSLSAAGLYWNATCLKQIDAPKFWSAASLEPIIARYKKAHPSPPPQPLPICKAP